MIHQPSSGFLGTSSDIKIAAQNILQIEAQIIEILSRHTGRTDEEIASAIQRDFWMTPDEAIDFGLIDDVAQPCTRKLMRARASGIRDMG
jgi:ATP-dependent Clp protease protease subunit